MPKRRPDSTPLERLTALVAARPGQRLPSERELAQELGIGRPALRGLLASLARGQLITRRQGSGTYAIDPKLAGPRRITVLVDAGIRLGQDPFFAEVLEALQGAVQGAGAACEVVRLQPGQRAPAALSALLIGGGCAQALGCWDAGTPAVAWLVEAEPPARARVSQVRLQDVAAGRAAGQLLIGQGCTHMVFAGHDLRSSPRDRLAGAREAAQAAGVRLELLRSGMNFEDGLLAIGQLPLQPHLGIIAANDWLAAGLSSGLLARGAPSVPVVGFDGLARARRLGSPSFAVPIEAIARDMVAELARLAGAAAVGRILSYGLELRPGEALPG